MKLKLTKYTPLFLSLVTLLVWTVLPKIFYGSSFIFLIVIYIILMIHNIMSWHRYFKMRDIDNLIFTLLSSWLIIMILVFYLYVSFFPNVNILGESNTLYLAIINISLMILCGLVFFLHNNSLLNTIYLRVSYKFSIVFLLILSFTMEPFLFYHLNDIFGQSILLLILPLVIILVNPFIFMLLFILVVISKRSINQEIRETNSRNFAIFFSALYSLLVIISPILVTMFLSILVFSGY